MPNNSYLVNVVVSVVAAGISAWLVSEIRTAEFVGQTGARLTALEIAMDAKTADRYPGREAEKDNRYVNSRIDALEKRIASCEQIFRYNQNKER